ncbi:hypothetical protein HN747_02725 [archaeon]|jgi:hypothetical protein|nr:hypothetical protein [archaeon]
MKINRHLKVVLSKNADNVYTELNKIVGEEIKRGIKSSFHQTLLRSIKRASELLKENPFAGDQIKKRLIPMVYIKKYGAENLWRIELANRWRLIYLIKTGELEIINFVVDIYDHKKYDKVFGYRH